MEKYQKGKIYKLTNEETNDVYYGSTTKTLKRRLQKHKSNYTGYLKGKDHFISSFEIIKYSSANIELVEELIIVFTNLKDDLLLLLQDDHEDNMDFKN